MIIIVKVIDKVINKKNKLMGIKMTKKHIDLLL